MKRVHDYTAAQILRLNLLIGPIKWGLEYKAYRVGLLRVVKVLGGGGSTKSIRKTAEAADFMSPWVHIAALEVDSDSNNENVNYSVSEIDE